jgi:hypothetical protein
MSGMPRTVLVWPGPRQSGSSESTRTHPRTAPATGRGGGRARDADPPAGSCPARARAGSNPGPPTRRPRCTVANGGRLEAERQAWRRTRLDAESVNRDPIGRQCTLGRPPCLVPRGVGSRRKSWNERLNRLGSACGARWRAAPGQARPRAGTGPIRARTGPAPTRERPGPEPRQAWP